MTWPSKFGSYEESAGSPVWCLLSYMFTQCVWVSVGHLQLKCQMQCQAVWWLGSSIVAVCCWAMGVCHYKVLMILMMVCDVMWCRQAELRGGSGVYPGTVWGEEQEHDEGGLLPPDLCHRYQQHSVCVRRRHRCHHCQQSARMWPLLTCASTSQHHSAVRLSRSVSVDRVHQNSPDLKTQLSVSGLTGLSIVTISGR